MLIPLLMLKWPEQYLEFARDLEVLATRSSDIDSIVYSKLDGHIKFDSITHTCGTNRVHPA